MERLNLFFTPTANKSDRINYFRQKTIILISIVGIIIGLLAMLSNRFLFRDTSFFDVGIVALAWSIMPFFALFLLKFKRDNSAKNLLLLLIVLSDFYIQFQAAYTDIKITAGLVVGVILIGVLAETSEILVFSFLFVLVAFILELLRINYNDKDLFISFLGLETTIIIIASMISLFFYSMRSQLDAHIKENEGTIKEINYLLQKVISTSPLPIYVVENNIIRIWNKNAEETFGWKAAEILGKPNPMGIPEYKQEERADYRRKILNGESIEVETERISKDGKVLNVSLFASPLRNSEGKVTGLIAITQDISERKEIEKKKDDFISMASHELKTPITSLKIYSSLLNTKLMEHDAPEDLKQLGLKIQKQMVKLSDLVKVLLDFSRIQLGKIHLDISTINSRDFIFDTLSLIEPVMKAHKIVVGKNDGIELMADKGRLVQVLVNLIVNAEKYSPSDTEIFINSEIKDGNLIISVQDKGIGISEIEQKKIFEKFFQSSINKDKMYPGLGIGLYISSEIVNLHGGKIWVESKLGDGSTFFISLPIKS